MIRFTKSPTGKFSLAYSKGNAAILDVKLEEAVVKAEYAVKITEKDLNEHEAAELLPKGKK